MSTMARLLIVEAVVVSIAEGVTYYLVRRYRTFLVVIPPALGAILAIGIAIVLRLHH
jgi:hypothetical protein